MTREITQTNYEIVFKAEMKKVIRCFYAYSSEQRADLAANFRAGYQQRRRTGEYYFVHPDVPNVAFPTRSRAAQYAMTKQER